MELLVRKRKPIRASFTRSYNILTKALTEEEPEDVFIQTHLANMERLMLNLSEVDDEICKILLKDDNSDMNEYEDEYGVIEEYREKMISARISTEMHFNKLATKESAVSSHVQEKTKLKLPKIEFLKFGGEIKDWLAFWSQFKRIHEDKLMEEEDKFQYLIQSMTVGSRAREIVDSFPPTAENYSKAVESLKNRFGREELLIEFYVRELLGLVIKNAIFSKSKVNTAQLYDKLESYLRALESIGMTSDKYAAMLFPLVESCIPEEILRVWLRNPVSTKNEESNTYIDRLKNLLLFLRNEVEGEERISLAKAGFKPNEKTVRKETCKETATTIPTAADLFLGINSNEKSTCVFCGKLHQSKECFRAQKLPMEEKHDILRKKKVCFTCLRVGHRSKQCKSNVQCVICSKRHWVLMCPELASNKKASAIEFKEDVDQNITLSNQCRSEVLLQTLLVILKTHGKTRIVRALIDTGSQRSYILENTAKQMGYEPVSVERLTQVVFGGTASKREHKCYEITVNSSVSNYCCKIRVLDQPTICGLIPRLKTGSCVEEARQKGIQLTDIGNNQSPIEILIGADFAGQLYTGLVHQLKCGLSAVQTYLGWVVMGKLHEGSNHYNYGSILTSLSIHSNNVTDLWKLESIGINDPCEQQDKEEVETAVWNHFNETVQINEDGRYEVCLPWMHNRGELPTNREIAEKRLNSTTSKLMKEEKFESYDGVFQYWLQEGIIQENSDNTGHFLPHRGVFKCNSSTNVRPVFDASCKPKGSFSLNDCLAKGPNLLEMLPTILFKFREKRIGVIADIEKAFLQISVNKNDREFLKFLWWQGGSQNAIKIYQHCRVVFGLNCSPFLLGAVIQHHLGKYLTSAQHEVIQKLKASFYVDNCVISVDTEKELQNFVQVSTQVMAEGKFKLRDWEHTEITKTCVKSKPSTVLGLLWDKQEDLLFCDISSIRKPEGIITRRIILSIAQRVFDPIGFTCPVTLYPKLLLQNSWKSKLSWDAEVSEDISKKFLKWVTELQTLSDAKIPRQAFVSDNSIVSLHVFCDASGASYAAAVYLRCETDMKVSVQLLIAKSRVAPLKKISIPRLELLACCIGARLADFVKKNMKLSYVKEYFWADSSTALYWIKRNEQWGVFVKNRVSEIRKLSDTENWRHVRSQNNPADLPSRGCSVKKLTESRWWEGPTWLKQDEKHWPQSECIVDEEEVFQERKKKSSVLLSETFEEPWFLSYFSKYTKIIRMVGWIWRFLNNTRKDIQDRQVGELSAEELNKAEKIIIRTIQRDAFTKERLLSLKSLCLFEDCGQLLRVKTKLTECKDEENFKYPMLLPSKHKLVELIIQEHHIMRLHAGLHPLLSDLREKFWILNGRRTVRRVISKCIRCKRHNARCIQTAPAPLPEDRVRQASVFEITGVDLAGPLILKGGEKSWVVLYTCAVYRAIHLELITSLSTEAFLLSFRRFIARRGRPNTIYSDNGSNFVGANNLLRKIDWKAVEMEASIRRITWKFNPPSAAWWGGFWERLIQMVKRLLRRVLGTASLGYEEMMSILCDCEAIVNARPLTYVSEDPENPSPLTPAMFLQDIQMVGVPDLDHINKVDLTKRLRYQQTLRDHLRKRFIIEYLGQLVQLKGKGETQNVKIGDIVLIECENKKRTFWPMAKITEIYPGKDGNSRVVKLKTATGETVRPVQRIYPLEIDCSSQEPETSLVGDKEIKDTTPFVLRKTVVTRRGRTVKPPLRFRQM